MAINMLIYHIYIGVLRTCPSFSGQKGEAWLIVWPAIGKHAMPSDKSVQSQETKFIARTPTECRPGKT